jgi:hypothetical protein
VNVFKILINMIITKHYCPNSLDEFFQISSEPGDASISINRFKGGDYLIEIFDASGKLIISCNFPSYMHSKVFDLSSYGSSEYLLKVSGTDETGGCMYRVSRES